MTFLPVVERELRVTARRWYTYWTRFFAALGTLAVCAWVWQWVIYDRPASERGQVLFWIISAMAFTYSLLAGILITADALSEEKREGTLGLLFLTDLKGYDVVLGKLAATSLNALYRLFSVFPILAIPLLLGALTLGEFWRMTLVLTNTLFFSLSAGIAVSAMSQRERRAMAGTFALILLLTAGPALLGWTLGFHPLEPTSSHRWLLSSAVFPAILALDQHYRLQPAQFWMAVLVTHILAWCLLAFASGVARRAWQDRPVAGRKAAWQDAWRAWQFDHGAGRLVRRSRLLDLNPILWQVARDRVRPILVWMVLFLLSLVWLCLYARFGSGLLDPTFYFLAAYCAHSILKFWVASEACRPLAEDRRSGALELVLSTPLPVKEILDGQLLALKHQFGWPVLAVLTADFAMLLGGLGERSWELSNDWIVLCLMTMVLFLADLYTLAWVGLWLSLRARRASHAIAGTVARILLLPWVVFILGLSVLAVFPFVNFEPGDLGLLTLAFALCLLNNAIFYSWSKVNLREQFRSLARQRFQPSPAWPESKELEEVPSAPIPAGAGVVRS